MTATPEQVAHYQEMAREATRCTCTTRDTRCAAPRCLGGQRWSNAETVPNGWTYCPGCGEFLAPGDGMDCTHGVPFGRRVIA